jgi:hypothetical protein
VTRLFALATTIAVTVLAAGCASSSSAGSSVPPATTAAAVASESAAPASAAPSVTSPADPVPSGAGVYFAESQDMTGTTAHAPGCQAGCPLSGDGTTVLWDMAWPTWTGSEAVGTGRALRVFLSHTSKLRKYPPDRSFMAAAERGVIRAGGTVVDMEYFSAREDKPAGYCREPKLPLDDSGDG